MAEVSGLDMVREIIGQINNLKRLVTINGKKYKWDGKKYVRAVDGKTFTRKELVSFVKDERFRAPGTDNPRKDPSRPKKQNLGDRLKSKAKGVERHSAKTAKTVANKADKLNQNIQLRIADVDPEIKKRANIKRNLNIRRDWQQFKPNISWKDLVKPKNLAKGLKGFGIGWAADEALTFAGDQLIINPVKRMVKSQIGAEHLTIAEYNKYNEEMMALARAGKLDRNTNEGLKNWIELRDKYKVDGGIQTQDELKAILASRQAENQTASAFTPGFSHLRQSRFSDSVKDNQNNLLKITGFDPTTNYLDNPVGEVNSQLNIRDAFGLPPRSSSSTSTSQDTSGSTSDLGPWNPDLNYTKDNSSNNSDLGPWNSDLNYTDQKGDNKSENKTLWEYIKPGMSERQIQSQINALRRKRNKASDAMKIRRLERELAIKRGYGNLNADRVNQLLNNPVTQRELEES